MGGSLGRTEATGYGVMYTVREAMKELGIDIRKTIGAFQGFGNVSQYAVRLYKQFGGMPICVACWNQEDQTSYTFLRKSGIDPDELVAMTDKFGTVDKDEARKAGMRSCPAMPGLSRRPTSWCRPPWRTRSRGQRPEDPQAGEARRRGGQRADDHRSGRRHSRPGIFLIPDFLCNAGGVTCSYFEQVQCNMNHYWSREEVLSQLDHKMTTGFKAVSGSPEKNVYMRDAAYMIAISRVADACRLRGWV